MKSRISRDLGIGVIFILIFVIATILRLFGVLESYQQFVVVLVSAAATYVIVAITMASQSEQQKALLQQQTDNDRRKEKDTKIFEEKLRIYQDFLHFLCEVIKDGEVTKEEAIQLEFQTSYITMHTESRHVKEIAKRVETIVNNLKSDTTPNAANTAETEANNNGELMKNLFDIVNEFRKELYPDLPEQADDESNRSEAVRSFAKIMDAVEVEQAEENVQTETATADTISIEQNLADFTTELLQAVNADSDRWTVESKVENNAIYINFAMKGKEEAVRVMLNHESNGEHYWQIHMDYDDTHEAYKHMKWRFGGRQNKWCWWKYLDVSHKTLSTTDAIKERNWAGLLAILSKQLKDLLTYVDTFQQVAHDIYYPAPGEKANVWMYYESCVAFDYEATLGDDRFFMDVVRQADGTYQIMFGNRDNDLARLVDRLHTVGFTDGKESDIKDNRYIAYTNLTAEQASAKVAEIDEKVNP